VFLYEKPVGVEQEGLIAERVPGEKLRIAMLSIGQRRDCLLPLYFPYGYPVVWLEILSFKSHMSLVKSRKERKFSEY